MQAIPQNPYLHEKFIRRFIALFSLPRFLLLLGGASFCFALLFLAFATLARWVAFATGLLIAITGFGLLVLFNWIRRVQTSPEYVLSMLISRI